MPVQPRASLEPLLPGSRDETYSDTNTPTSPGGDTTGRPRSGSLDSLVSLDGAAMRQGLGQLVPEGRDRAAVFLILGGLLLFLPGTWALVLRSNPSELGYFAPHAPLNALAVTCFALGIAAVQPPTPPAGVRAARLAVHQRILLGLALPAMAAGTAFMYTNKAVHAAPHFTTWHAWCGCATVVWMLGQAALGAASVWGGGRVLGGGVRAKGWYKYHRISGYLLVAFALLTATLGGGFSTWASQRFPVLRFAAFGVGVPLVLLGLLLRIRPEKMRIR